MKTNLEVQYNDYNVNTTDIEKMVKEDVKAKGTKISTIESLEIYYTPENSAVYYVATTKDGDTISSDDALMI